MRKLSLKLDELAVESFQTDGMQEQRGTVAGYVVSMDGGCVTDEGQSCGGSCPYEGTCGEWSCGGNCGSYYGTCGGSCAVTCGDTCYYTCANGMTCHGADC